MATTGAVRTALAGTIDNVSDLRVVEYLTESSPLPAAEIRFSGSQREAMQRGAVTMTFDVTVAVPLSISRISTTSIDTLTAWSGSGSIIHQIETNRTLGVSDVDAHVSNVGGDTAIEGFGIEHLARTLTVVVVTRGDS